MNSCEICAEFCQDDSAVDGLYRPNSLVLRPDIFFPQEGRRGILNVQEDEWGTSIPYLKSSEAKDRVITMTSIPIKSNYISLQKWEGIVLSVSKDSFTARLIDLSHNTSTREICELTINEIAPEDIDLLDVGAIFYWNIGYYDSSRGQRFRQSMIRFRRLPSWSAAEISSAKEAALKVSSVIGWGI